MKKKFINVIVAFLGCMMLGFSACAARDVHVKYADVPTPVKQFLGRHFGGAKVKSVIAERDGATMEYDIVFFGGTKIEVKADGNWSDISNYSVGVPVSVLPKAAQNYIATNYAGQKVVKIDRDRKGYEVKLASGTELEFDPNGVFLRIDH